MVAECFRYITCLVGFYGSWVAGLGLKLKRMGPLGFVQHV